MVQCQVKGFKMFAQPRLVEMGALQPLPAKHVDTGMGFERVCSLLQGAETNYETDVFQPLIGRIAELSGLDYGAHRVPMQVMADHAGGVVHLYERECSVQRRHQKLIEEAPSPFVDDALRRRMGDAAVAVAREAGYVNAGTVEFLVDAQRNFYFLEMNTRLQVEHGVTELTTGVDVVELQLRIAAGERLPIEQKDIHPRGHAIEVRIYPEDPETFLPDAGTVTELNQPVGEHIRIDSALYQGYQVALEYEPLLAKLMVWGENREEAIKRMSRALLAFRLEGVKCNIPLMRDILATKEYTGSVYHTGSVPLWLEERKQRHSPWSANGASTNGASKNGVHSTNGHHKSEKEKAAAIGVAMAFVLQSTQNSGPAAPLVSPWRIYGRREQLLSRSMGNRGWR